MDACKEAIGTRGDAKAGPEKSHGTILFGEVKSVKLNSSIIEIEMPGKLMKFKVKEPGV